MEKVIIVGAGAQAKYAVEIFHLHQNHDVIGVIDTLENRDMWGSRIDGIEVVGGLSYLDEYAKRYDYKAIVTCSDNKRKESLIAEAKKKGISLVNAIHPQSIIARTAVIGENVLVNAGAIIQPFAHIGNGVMIHAGAVIEHDDVIEDFVNVGPGAKLAGWVKVKRRAYIYTGASIIPKIEIGEDAIVAAGAVVTRNVPNKSMVAGNPARLIKTVS